MGFFFCYFILFNKKNGQKNTKFVLEVFFLLFLSEKDLCPSLFARLCEVWEKQAADDYPRAESRNQVTKGEGISGLAVSHNLAQIIQLLL